MTVTDSHGIQAILVSVIAHLFLSTPASWELMTVLDAGQDFSGAGLLRPVDPRSLCRGMGEQRRGTGYSSYGARGLSYFGILYSHNCSEAL